jgi:hypothetical protein
MSDREFGTDIQGFVLAGDSLRRAEAEVAEAEAAVAAAEQTYEQPYYEDDGEDWQDDDYDEQESADPYYERAEAALDERLASLVDGEPVYPEYEAGQRDREAADSQARLEAQDDLGARLDRADGVDLIRNEFLPPDSQIDPELVLELGDAMLADLKAAYGEQIDTPEMARAIVSDVVKDLSDARWREFFVAQAGRVR